MAKRVSSCCQADVRVEARGTEGNPQCRRYYVCCNCGEQCSAYVATVDDLGEHAMAQQVHPVNPGTGR